MGSPDGDARAALSPWCNAARRAFPFPEATQT